MFGTTGSRTFVMAILATGLGIRPPDAADRVYPANAWQAIPPEEAGMDGAALDRLAKTVGGKGCIVRHGCMVKTWGSQSEHVRWFSSSKPVISTLLFFAIEEGKVSGVDAKVGQWDWKLSDKDRPMTFRHLANMVSGYARPEPPGAAFAYNDYGIQLYRLTLEKVFQENLTGACRKRFAPLQFQDAVTMPRFVHASVRDFARIGWFWLNKGNWNGRQLLPRKYFDDYMKPQLPGDLPETDHSVKTNDDYLKIGTYGGGSDHFTRFGPGIYGFNWWFNATGRRHPRTPTWPSAPRDTFMSIGFGGNNCVIIPSLDIVFASGDGKWGQFQAGDPKSGFNTCLELLVAATRPELARAPSGKPGTGYLFPPGDFSPNKGGHEEISTLSRK